MRPLRNNVRSGRPNQDPHSTARLVSCFVSLSTEPPPDCFVAGPVMPVVETVVVNLPLSNEEIPVGSVRKGEDHITILVCPSHDRSLTTALHPMRIPLAGPILVASNRLLKLLLNRDLRLARITRRGLSRESTTYHSRNMDHSRITKGAAAKSHCLGKPFLVTPIFL